jgi:hypothetical protein
MNTHADKTPEHKSQAHANRLSKRQGNGESTVPFVDNRPAALAQQKLQEAINTSPRVQQLRAFQEMANTSRPKQLKTAIESPPGIGFRPASAIVQRRKELVTPRGWMGLPKWLRGQRGQQGRRSTATI